MVEKRFYSFWVCIFASILVFGCGGNGGEKGDGDVQEIYDPVEQDADVPIDEAVQEDIPVEVDGEVEEIEEVTEAEGPSTVTIKGQVWSYRRMMEIQYYVQPEGGIEVSVEGEGINPVDFTATTSSNQCDNWWDLGEPFECGKFEISGIPNGAEIMLRAKGLSGGQPGPDTISKIFTAQDGMFVLLVVVSQDLIDALLQAWHITQDDNRGMVAGILATHLNPDSTYKPGDNSTCPDTPEQCVVSGFIGNAIVEITPDPGCNGCNRIIYFDSSDYTNTSRTSTDPDQSLFFVTNSPPHGMTNPYTISVRPSSIGIADTRFAVRTGTLTYLLLMP